MEISFCFFYRTAHFLLKLGLDNPYQYPISKSLCIKIWTLIAFNNTKTKEMLKNIYQVATYGSGYRQSWYAILNFKKQTIWMLVSIWFFGNTAFLLRHVFEKSQSILHLNCTINIFSVFNNILKEFVSTDC